MSIILEQMNSKISNTLKVPKLKITYKVSEKAKSKFGHCRYIEPGHYLINLSSFILDTELEKDTICHELCHAYDHHYFKPLPHNNDPAPHGIAWKMMMDQVFGYVNVKAQGIDLYIEGNKKAMFKISGKMVNIRTPQNKIFDNVLEEEKYMTIFIKLYKR
jgi:predicted SprT family Zn-dependent metalloprotease